MGILFNDELNYTVIVGDWQSRTADRASFTCELFNREFDMMSHSDDGQSSHTMFSSCKWKYENQLNYEPIYFSPSSCHSDYTTEWMCTSGSGQAAHDFLFVWDRQPL